MVSRHLVLARSRSASRVSRFQPSGLLRLTRQVVGAGWDLLFTRLRRGGPFPTAPSSHPEEALPVQLLRARRSLRTSAYCRNPTPVRGK